VSELLRKGIGRLQLVPSLVVILAMPTLGAVCEAAPRQADAMAGSLRKPLLSAEEIVSCLQEKNRARELALRSFHGTRVYRVNYRGFFGEHHAEAVVNFDYTAPDKREFTIVSEAGSKFIVDHVIKGLLQGEEEAARGKDHERNALNASNYSFKLASADGAGDGSQYVLNVSPKTHYKYLYKGKIWVDGKDFAVTRIEAEPARSPSFWVKHTDVDHQYEKVGSFWLPAQDKTESWIRLGGIAHLSIEYKDYRITSATPVEQAPAAEGRSESRASQ
jgi:outer membrane lipoprotein-sorting protein